AVRQPDRQPPCRGAASSLSFRFSFATHHCAGAAAFIASRAIAATAGAAAGKVKRGGTMAVSLFDPIKLGAIDAPNRIIMAPLTRGRAGPGFVPNELAREYYRQRASAGLIISEATGISQEGLGWPSAPGLWTDAQVEGWKPVTDAGDGAGGRIVAQLWHMGRVVHSVFNDGKPPVSASATQAPGKAHTPAGRLEYEVARPLELGEIPRVIADYIKA